MNVDFEANKTPDEVTKEAAFGGNYFRDILLVLIVNGTESHGKNFMS